MKQLLLFSFFFCLFNLIAQNDSTPVQRIKLEKEKPIIKSQVVKKGPVANCEYDEIYQVSEVEGWIKVKNFGKYGFIDSKCIEIVPCIYDEINVRHVFIANSILVKNEKKYGFIDYKGKEFVPCVYDKIEKFGLHDGLYLVYSNKKIGILKENGKELVSCNYDEIYGINSINTEWIKVKNEGKLGFIDLKGKEVVPCVYDKIHENNILNTDVWILVEKEGKFGFIDYKGKEIVPCIYDKIYPFDQTVQGKAVVEINKKKYMLDRNGKVI